MNCRFILYIILFSITPRIFAQFYDTGQDPSSLKWLQIKTNRFTLIYPESYGQEGLKFAKSLDKSFTRLTSLYPVRKVHIPVIIHNYTSFSNGYVVWAPKRMEIYPTPEQNGIPLDPAEQLTTHELTHVLQMFSLNRGFTKVVSILSGEPFTGLVTGLFLPGWFMEGDAVFAESLLSPSGRGRSPSFLKQMKAIALDKPKMYSYDKILSGSFKNFTPDQYQYGYQMIAWSYAKYDSQLWNKTLDFTAKNPYTINPVNLSLLKNAGLTKSKLYTETFDSLKTIWQREELKNNPAGYKALNQSKKKDYVNYYSPVIIGKDSVIVIKTSFSSTPEFILINLADRSETKIHTPGSMYPYFLSGSAGKIVWVENQPDPRWENRSYSVVKIMDIRQKITRKLSFRSRYLAAAISSDGRFIAAAENSVKNENFLVIIDAFKGQILHKIPVPGNAYPQRPQWSQTGNDISIVYLSDNGEGIMSYSMENMSWKTHIYPGRDDLQSAVLRNDSLFFVSSSSGTDNIYVLAPDNSISKITNSRFGAYDPLPVTENILFSDYSSSGYNICETKIDGSIPYTKIEAKDPNLLLSRFDTIKIKDTDTSLFNYKPKPYRKLGHLFGLHTWMPFYADIEKIQADPTTARPGITLMSQNQLSTVISSIGYEYSADKSHLLHTRVTWKGWLPVIESQLNYGGNAGISKMGNNVYDPVTVQPGLDFNTTISLPLNFSSGRFSQFLRPSVSGEFTNNYIYIKEKATYNYGQTIISGRIFFYNYQKSAIRDIYPKWAQVIDLNYAFAPFDKEIYGHASALKTSFYFPGIFPNHGIRFKYETEIQKPQKFFLYQWASLPRGYNNIISQDLNFFSVDYAMPLLYPDLNIPGILFISRIRSTFFYDYARGTKNQYLNPRQFNNYTETFKTFGAELMTDFYFLRIPFMISAGVQSSWKNLNEPPAFQLLFNIDILGMKIGRSKL
jgi:hypothetical protein